MKRFLTIIAAAGAVFLAAASGADPKTPPAPVRILAVGDSLTEGAKSSDRSGYRKDLYAGLTAAGYAVTMVGSQSGGEFPQPHHEGHGGWTVADIAGQVDGWIKDTRPDVILLMIGTNDVIGASHETDPAKAKADVEAADARLKALLDRITAGAPKADLIVASIPPMYTDLTGPYNAAIPGLVDAAHKAGHRVTFCDIAKSGVTVADEADYVHPNDAGYSKIASGWLPVVKKVLQARDRKSLRRIH